MNSIKDIKVEIIKPEYFNTIEVIDYSISNDNNKIHLHLKLQHSIKLTLYKIFKFFSTLSGVNIFNWDADPIWDFDTTAITYLFLEIDPIIYKNYLTSNISIKKFINEILLMHCNKNCI